MSFIAVTMVAALAFGQEWPEPDEQGVTVNLGYAPGFGGLGAGVGFVGSVDPEIHIMPHIGVGIFAAKRIRDDRVTKVLWGPGGGVLFMHGGRHRIVLDVTYGIVGHEEFTLHDYVAGSRALWGVSTLAGYAYMTQRGFMVRGEVGPGFATTPYSVGNRVSLQGGIVIGYTFR